MGANKSAGPADLADMDKGELRAEVVRLQGELKSRDLSITKQDAVIADLQASNDRLAGEIDALKTDLDQVETQFVSLERGIVSTETKATAVAAIAEVKLLLERIVASEQTRPDSLTVAEVRSKLETADRLTSERNYPAAVYFANRAMRVINISEHRHYTDPGATWIISVSAANMRNGPGTGYPVLNTLDYGTVVVELSRKNDWYRVETRDGRAGWVHGSLIR